MQAYLDFSPVRSAEPINNRPPFQKYYDKARIYVEKTPTYYAVLSLAKGGVLKVTDAEGTLYSDTGLIGRTADGKVIVSHLVDDYDISADVANRRFRAAGRMCLRKQKLATPFTQIVFRLINLTLGRFAPNLLRRMLQKILITGKPRTEYRFEREFAFGPDQVGVTSRLSGPADTAPLRSLHIGSDATSIYVANSNVYQRSVLYPWQDLTPLIGDMAARGQIEHLATVNCARSPGAGPDVAPPATPARDRP